METVDNNDKLFAVKDAFCQTQISNNNPLSVEKLRFNSDMFHFYTGLQNYQTFKFVLRTLGDGAYHLIDRSGSKPKLPVEEQFLVTLMRLRRYTPFKELAFFFGTNERTISTIFITWINFMYCKWKLLDIWPSKDMVNLYCPADFKRLYPTTRVILDGVECPIRKPKNPRLQQITYSTYKSRNTVKSVPGITPGGLVSYLPPVFGGSDSDRQFVERSNVPKLCDRKDSILVDKGFDIQDIFAPSDITVNISTFLREGNQFTATQLRSDRKIASKRVHVERVIGLAKTYKILERPMNDIETVLAERIIFSCFMLCNFRPIIVPENA